jgi:hypothetical protein
MGRRPWSVQRLEVDGEVGEALLQALAAVRFPVVGSGSNTGFFAVIRSTTSLNLAESAPEIRVVVWQRVHVAWSTSASSVASSARAQGAAARVDANGSDGQVLLTAPPFSRQEYL